MNKYPHPNGSGKMVSRQRIHQIRLKNAGKCIRCGKLIATKSYCQKCRKSSKAYILKNKEKYKKYQKENSYKYKGKYKERIKGYNEKYRQAHKTELSIIAKKYYNKNHAIILAKRKQKRLIKKFLLNNSPEAINDFLAKATEIINNERGKQSKS